jgi:type IV pilus assembly protein PilY1
VVLFTTMSPESVICGSGGSGWLMALDIASGSRMYSSPFDVNGDGQFTSGDLDTPAGFPVGTLVAISGVKVKGGIPSAPFVIEAADGMKDLVAVNISGGYVGGSGVGGSGTGGNTVPVQKFGVRGRLSWERLK